MLCTDCQLGLVTSRSDRPGSALPLGQVVTLGPSEPNPDTGTVATTVYYGVNTEGRTVLKWANDQGFQGIVQVQAAGGVLCY